MNCLEYFRQQFPTTAFDRLLNIDAGAGDGNTLGDILAEMPVESNCGDDCKTAIDAAHALDDCMKLAYGTNHKVHHRENIIRAVLDACACYIRG